MGHRSCLLWTAAIALFIFVSLPLTTSRATAPNHTKLQRTLSPGVRITSPAGIAAAKDPTWPGDTLVTSTISLAVRQNGNMGMGDTIGTVNMNFRPPAECDIGSNSRGNAAIYLFEASPIVVRDPAVESFAAFYSMYQGQGFNPVATGPAPYDSQTVNYQKYFGGEALTGDGLVRTSNTWWAPKRADSSNFIIHKLQLWPEVNGSAVSSVAIGEVFDWDIPTDSGYANNVGGFDASRGLVWMRGFNSADAIADCQDNSLRFGGAALIGMRMESALLQDSLLHGILYGGFTMPPDSLASGMVTYFSSAKTWNAMITPGYSAWTQIVDQLGMLVFKSGSSGYTLPANDTLTIFTVMASVRTAASTPAGLDSLKKAIDQGKRWCNANLLTVRPPSCCQGRRGNVNMSGVIDLADLSALVSYLTGGGFVLPCYEAADINGNGVVDLGDLSCVVDMFTGGFCQGAPCPQ
jgi:hypothetical protein